MHTASLLNTSCNFFLCSPVFLDVEPPSIDWCRSPPPMQVSEKEYPAVWDEPQFSDNSGADAEILWSAWLTLNCISFLKAFKKVKRNEKQITSCLSGMNNHIR